MVAGALRVSKLNVHKESKPYLKCGFEAPIFPHPVILHQSWKPRSNLSLKSTFEGTTIELI